MFTFLKRHLLNYKREIVSDVLVGTAVQSLTSSMLTSEKPGTTPASYVEGSELVVSLTTYGQRIHHVHIAIESLLQQTLPPNRIVLWLDEAEFSDATLPAALQRQKRRGLEVRYCANLRSYKKLIPTLKQYPSAAVITVDDDFIYPCDLVERLLRAHQSDPSCVWFVRGNLMTLDDDGNPQPYERWAKMPDTQPPRMAPCAAQLAEGSPLAFPTGGAGALYPPGSFHPDMTDAQLFMQLCPTADDIWFKMMTLLQGTTSRLVVLDEPFATKFLQLPDWSDTALYRVNLGDGANDRQMKQVWAHYKDELTRRHLLQAASSDENKQ